MRSSRGRLFKHLGFRPNFSFINNRRARKELQVSYNALVKRLEGRTYSFAWRPYDNGPEDQGWSYSGSGTWRDGWDLIGMEGDLAARAGWDAFEEGDPSESQQLMMLTEEVKLMRQLLETGEVKIFYGIIYEDKEHPQDAEPVAIPIPAYA